MPVIEKIERKKTNRIQTKNRELRLKYYNTPEWRKCRENHLRKEPICRKCWDEGKAYGGTKEDPIQVHHIKSPFNYINGTCDMALFLDDENLQTICSYHHGLEHNEKKEKIAEQIIKELEELFK